MTRLTALLIATGLFAAACGADVAVTATRSDAPAGATAAPPFDPGTPAIEDDGNPDDPPSGPTTTPPVTAPTVSDPNAINFGPNKPARPYDDFLLATLADLDTWWEQTYPEVYGEAWQPLHQERCLCGVPATAR